MSEPTPGDMPADWCPECDGPGECQPGTCCGRPYPGLPEAERHWRQAVPDSWGCVELDDDKSQVLLAEYDRLRAALKAQAAVVKAATALVEDAQEHGGAVSNDLLVALAAEVAALSDTEGSGT